MVNNKLIKTNDGIFTKVSNYFRKIIYSLSNNKVDKEAEYHIEKNDRMDKETEHHIEKNNRTIDKAEFMSLYDKMKKGEILLASLDSNTLEKMYNLMKEEIKLVQKQIDNLTEET